MPLDIKIQSDARQKADRKNRHETRGRICGIRP